MAKAPKKEKQIIEISDGRDLANILLYAIEIGVSDIHLSVGEPPMYRLNGKVCRTNLPPHTRDTLHSMLYDILDDTQRKILERDKELDFAMAFGEHARFRVNCFYTMRGEGAVFRVIPTKIKTLDSLSMPPVLKRISDKPRGLILVTGPTGSGKSTTLAAIIDHINSNRDDHILTIEDPIEFVHPNKLCVVNQREVGPNTSTFASALRSALREDPDVILVGEMRDLETISLAISAAETGHLVFGTLHTQSAPKTCDRIIDVFPPQQQTLVRTMFAESFQAVICQTLLARRDGNGRVCAMEIMIGITATRSLIREGKTHQLPSIIQTNARIGMQSLDQDIKNLLMRKIISEREALMKCNNPDFIVKNGVAKLEEIQGGRVLTSVMSREGMRNNMMMAPPPKPQKAPQSPAAPPPPLNTPPRPAPPPGASQTAPSFPFKPNK